MNAAYRAYRALTSGLYTILSPFASAVPRFSNETPGSLRQRLGTYPSFLAGVTSKRPRIWFHAASVGEVSGAVGILVALRSLLPEATFILSTTTRHGQQLARDKAGGFATCIYAPLDFPATVSKSLVFFKPDVIVLVETELWPNWLVEAQRMGIGTAVVNGRISVRSIKSYRRLRVLFGGILSGADAFSMIQEEDAERIRQIGAPSGAVFVNGNAKYDPLFSKAPYQGKEAMAGMLALDGNRPVFVAGSTRTGEEGPVLDAYDTISKVLPDTVLIVAPRHLSRVPQVARMVAGRRWEMQLRTEISVQNPRCAKIVIMDTIGELSSVYGNATVVFCGGSLVPLGGHNILEAAVWGKPVLYGPHMEDFLDARRLLESAGAGLTVTGGTDLAEQALYLLRNPEKAEAMGRAAREAIHASQGAALRHAEVVRNVLRKRGVV